MVSLKWSLASLWVCSVELACAEVRVRDCVKEWSEWEVGRSDSCALSLVSLSNILDDHQVTNVLAMSCDIV